MLLYAHYRLFVVELLQLCEKQREKIYVLDGGKSLMMALSQDLSQNRPAEAREHVRRFHELFFSLSPQKDAIGTTSTAPCNWRTRAPTTIMWTLPRRILQPPDIGQHQSGGACGQRGV